MKNLLLDAPGVDDTLNQMVQALIKDWKQVSQNNLETVSLCLIGVRTRGVPMAHRLAQKIQQITGHEIKVGVLDITLYRDDLSHNPNHPVVKATDIPFSLDHLLVYLVDDVFYTGRTTRCALNALFDFGRPAWVRLAVLVDRGGRQLPLAADIVGIQKKFNPQENIQVRLTETDGMDCVEVVSP